MVSATPLYPVTGSQKLEAAYDYQGRRILKMVSTYNAGSWERDTTKTFVYDGWNVIQEQTTQGSQVTIEYYVWGRDLSGSLQGAGGIGGLLLWKKASGTFLYLYDANGNVGQLVNAATGVIAARYDYDPFGKTLVADGPEAQNNLYRYSTKSFDGETGLYYYGYRYYSPKLGRWTTRDPIGEMGGINLYAFVGNTPLNRIDYLGLDDIVVAGGVSVNDPERHDQSPWNFLNASVLKARELKKAYANTTDKNTKVFVIMYTPGYERRAKYERETLKIATRTTDQYYLDVMKTAAQRDGFELITIRSADELTTKLNSFSISQVTSVSYYGHSNVDNLFLEYSSVEPSVSTDYWGEEDAKKVTSGIFSPIAVFASYGCYQGETGGLAERIREIWKITAIGSVGKTDYKPIGQGLPIPTSEGGYKEYVYPVPGNE